MESNGKFLTKNRQRVNYQSGVSILMTHKFRSELEFCFETGFVQTFAEHLVTPSTTPMLFPRGKRSSAGGRGCSQLGPQRGDLLQAQQERQVKTKKLNLQPQVHSATDSAPPNTPQGHQRNPMRPIYSTF
jgi:hypothetical protein